MPLNPSDKCLRHCRMSNRYIVIMAGGKGERFWPQSRRQAPKHLLCIVGEKPMLTQTVERLDGLLPVDHIFVITNREHRETVLLACPGLPEANVVSEPEGRDTAAAVGLAMLLVKKRDPDAVFAVLPADHVIEEREGFQKVLKAAFEVAEAEPVLVTLGIGPTEPATGYGYIQKGKPLREVSGRPVYEVRRFVEKPDLEKAKEYLASGEYFWNGGMFVWSVNSIEKAFAEWAPSLYQGLREVETRLDAGEDFEGTLDVLYPGLEKISIDYAIMEKASAVVALEATFDWDDVGEWPAVARHFPADENGNVCRGEAVVQGGSNNIVISGGNHLIALVGTEDLIVVHTDDATLVCPRNKAQEIKDMVKRLAADPKYSKLT